MKKAIVTGSCGLVGSAAVEYLSKNGFQVIGVDNNERSRMFGNHASTSEVGNKLLKKYPNFELIDADIRDFDAIENIFKKHGDLNLVYHLAAQCAHDWATTHTMEDFHINATGTMNMLESYRRHGHGVVFIHCSTSKVYGDIVNSFPYIKQETRYDLDPSHPYYDGFDEKIGYLDNNLRSLFGASKCCGDIMAQEYGKYFHFPIAIFRPACISGSNHKGDKLHGFLAYNNDASASEAEARWRAAEKTGQSA